MSAARNGAPEIHGRLPLSVTLSRPEGPCEGSRCGCCLSAGQRQQPQPANGGPREGRNDNVLEAPERSRTAARKAFTLIEALLALAILATATAGIFLVRSDGLRNAARARDEHTAAMIASRLLSLAQIAPGDIDAARHAVPDHPGFAYRVGTGVTQTSSLGVIETLRIEVYCPAAKGEEEQVLVVETLVGLPKREPATP